MSYRVLAPEADRGDADAGLRPQRLDDFIGQAAEKANLDLVTQFCAAWKSRDAAKIGAFLHDDCVVRFTATRDESKPVLGRQGVTDQVGKYLAGASIEFLVQESYAKGPLVINRRVDTVASPKGKQDIAVVGMFYLRGGKIKEWLDFEV